MGLRRKLRNPWAVAQIIAVFLGIAWASSALAQYCPEVVLFRVGDKSGFIGWRMPENEDNLAPSPQHPEGDFGGYRIWMREVWKGDEFTLLREYRYNQHVPGANNNWDFPRNWFEEAPICTLWSEVYPDSCLVEPIRGVRRDSTDIFQNAFPYEFSVTAFLDSDPNAINYDCREANRTGVVYPRLGARSKLSGVKCIPNPYRASADWEYGGQRRVVFVGLPAKATIRIYTTSLDHVVTLEHPQTKDTGTDQCSWNLKNEDNEDVAPGVYLYQVDAGSLGSIESKMMIIK